MRGDALLIDADGHILEPPDLWEKYLEGPHRDRALRIRVGDDGYEYLEIDGKRATLPRPGQLGTLGGMGKRVDEARGLRERAARGEVRPEEVRGLRPGPEATYLRGAAFGTMDMKERVQLLDREGLARAVLYPTLGLLWEAELFDIELSAAYCRAYNRWHRRHDGPGGRGPFLLGERLPASRPSRRLSRRARRDGGADDGRGAAGHSGRERRPRVLAVGEGSRAAPDRGVASPTRLSPVPGQSLVTALRPARLPRGLSLRGTRGPAASRVDLPCGAAPPEETTAPHAPERAGPP